MKKEHMLNRIMAVILAAVLALPVSVFAVDEVSPEAELQAEPAAPASELAADEEDQETEQPGAVIDSLVEDLEPMIGFLENVTIDENPSGTVEINWNEYDGAVYYEISSPKINNGSAIRMKGTSHTFTGLEHGAVYDFVIVALDWNERVIAQSAISIETVPFRVSFIESLYRTLRSMTVTPEIKLNWNLTSMINEDNDGYAVVQGGCTDGSYAYYLMVSTSTQHGRVLKVRISNGSVVARSGVLNTWHGNGMTYDSKRNKLVVIAREHRKQEITLIDARTLKITRQENVKYNYYANSNYFTRTHQERGLAAIAYVEKYDCYIVLQRNYHNLMIFDPDTFEAIGLVYTTITEAFPGTYQAMDADEKYVYLLLSYYNDGDQVQEDNVILALDWNSENLLPVANASKSKDPKYVEKPWYCNNNKSGRPDAVIRLNTAHEAENIFHTTDKNGNEKFYLSEYYGHYVRSNGRTYFKRDNFVYYLGIL